MWLIILLHIVYFSELRPKKWSSVSVNLWQHLFSDGTYLIETIKCSLCDQIILGAA